MRLRLFFLLVWVVVSPFPSHAGALHEAAKAGDTTAIVATLEAGADVNEIGGGGEATALYYSAVSGHLETARTLIARGADVNIASKWGGAPIIAAAWKGHAEFLSLLLAKGADPNASFKTDTTLHKAADGGCLDCVKLLVEAGADVNAINDKREPPIHFARRNGLSAVAQYLRENGYVTPVPAAISDKMHGADPVKGQALFEAKCKNCHDRTAKMWNGYGPSLWRIVGRGIASVAGYNYSQAIREKGGKWTYEELNGFIADTKRYLPGTQMWAEDGYQDEADRIDLIAYLRSLSETPAPLP